MNNLQSRLTKDIWLITILVVLLVALNIGIEQLTNQKITGAEVLLIRSFANLIAVFFISAYTQKSIIPKQPQMQIGVFLCLGLSLLLFYTAYQYISAGSVSTLQRLDIPVLVLAATFIRKITWQQILLAAFAFILVAVLLILNKATSESPLGYIIVLSGVGILCINTVLQKKIATLENIQTIIFISSISSFFWAGVRCYQIHATFSHVHLSNLCVIIGLSFINLLIFYIVNHLYKKHQPEIVRYPYLLAAFLTMVTEMIIAQKLFSPILIIGNTSILLVLTLLVRSRQKSVLSVN